MPNNDNPICKVCNGDGIDKTGTKVVCYACNGTGVATQDPFDKE